MAWVERPPPPTLPSLSSLPSFHTLSLSLPPSLRGNLAPPPLRPHNQYQTMPPPPVPSSRKRKSLRDDDSPSPAPESSASPSSHAGSEYDPVRGGPLNRAQPRAKRALQTKPPASNTGSATPTGSAPTKTNAQGRPMSREQLRKANHSLIERRRREKINQALSELRNMVPGLGDDGGKGGEFKLEVLERTVEHMRELKAQIGDLEARLSERPRSRATTTHATTESDSIDDMDVDYRHSQPSSGRKVSTPPSPSMTPPLRSGPSPDPNETEVEADLPPPMHLASRDRSDEGSSGHTTSPHPPSIASLLSSAQSNRTILPSRHSGPSPNLNVYLPFPTPSPTSPFLTAHTSSASTASSTTGPPEPSPFMAPLQGTPLFGGVLSFDSPETHTGKQPSPPDLDITMPPPPGRAQRDRNMAPEEAANLLLAFSSPECRATPTGTTPLMSAVSIPPPAHGRRMLDEEFTLDGGVATHHRRVSGGKIVPSMRQGKTARDILRM